MPVERGGTKILERLKVYGRAIALVRGESVTGIGLVPDFHPAVSFDLGYDRGGGDRDRAAVTADQRFLRQVEFDPHGIHQQIVGRNSERSNRITHRQP